MARSGGARDERGSQHGEEGGLQAGQGSRETPVKPSFAAQETCVGLDPQGQES